MLLTELLCWESFSDTHLQVNEKQNKTNKKLNHKHTHNKKIHNKKIINSRSVPLLFSFNFKTLPSEKPQVDLWKLWDNMQVAKMWLCPEPDNNCTPLLALQ